MKEASRDYIDLWLEQFTRQSFDYKTRTILSKEAFDNWQEFVMENNIKCEYSSVQFNKKLSLMCVDGIENKKGSKGIRVKVFDIKKLEAKYGIVRND